MGLFSKTVTMIESSSTLLCQEVPGLLKQTVYSAIFQNRNIGADLVTNISTGLLSKSKSYYSYGRLGETSGGTQGYVYGLPNGSLSHHSIASHTTVRLVIQKELGKPILLDSVVLDSGINTSNPADLYYIAKYHLMDNRGEAVGELLTWVYRENDGTYPELDIPTEKESEKSPYYPIIPLREHQEDMSQGSHKGTQLHLTSKRAMRRMGLDFDSLCESVHANPDINDIDFCYFMMGVDIATENDLSNEYLYEFFNDLHRTQWTDKTEYNYWLGHNSTKAPPPINKITISDSNYKMDIGWNYMDKELKTGVVGKLGFVKKSLERLPVVETPEYTSYSDALVLRKQVTATQYSELFIHGLIHVNYIYANDTVRTTLPDAFGDSDDKNNFIVPLNVDICTRLGALKSHDILYDAMRLVFNTKITKKLKWYQTGIFKVLVMVVAIVITAFSAGAFAPGITVAASMGIIGTAALSVIITSVVLEVGLSLVENVFGAKIALIAAVIASAVGLQVGLSGVTTSISAQSIMKSIGMVVTYFSQENYMDHMQKLRAEAETLKKETEEVDKLLSVGIKDPLDTFGLAYNYDPILDSPEFYYESRIHMGNSAVSMLSMPEMFVEVRSKLSLPYNPIRTRVY